MDEFVSPKMKRKAVEDGMFDALSDFPFSAPASKIRRLEENPDILKTTDEILEQLQAQKLELSRLNSKINYLEKQLTTQQTTELTSQKKQETVASRSQPGTHIPYKNLNLSNKFTPIKLPMKPAQFVLPQLKTYEEAIQSQKKASQNHITTKYLANISQIINFLNTKPRQAYVRETEGYTTQRLQGYNKLIALPKTSSNLVKTTFSYGLLHTLYTTDASELQDLSEIYKAAKTYLAITKASLIYVRFYSTLAEITETEILSPLHVVKLGVTKSMLIPEPQQQPEIPMADVQEFILEKRIRNCKVIFEELQRQYVTQKPIWLYGSNSYQIIYSQATTLKPGSLEEIERWLHTLAKPDQPSTSRAIRKKIVSTVSQPKYCRQFQQVPEHRCSNCQKEQEICDVKLT